jgi:hypothetical protein
LLDRRGAVAAGCGVVAIGAAAVVEGAVAVVDVVGSATVDSVGDGAMARSR